MSEKMFESTEEARHVLAEEYDDPVVNSIMWGMILELSALKSSVEQHAREHLCLRRHSADELPETSGESLCIA
jgi:hypothetical protein